MRVAVLASGQGSNLQSLLDACAVPSHPARIALAVSNRPECGALSRAAAAGVPTAVTAPDGRDAAGLLALLSEHAIELVVLAGYLKKVPAAVVRAYRGWMLNIHPALLPAFGGPGMYGRRVHAAVLAAGERVSGATVHVVDVEYDRGPVVAQWPVPVRPGDTAETLAARVLAVEHRLLPAVVGAVARRRDVPAGPTSAMAPRRALALPRFLDDALAPARPVAAAPGGTVPPAAERW